MSIRDQLHRLVDVLPEAETGAALRFLEYLRDAPNGDEITRILMTAPEADEPFTPEEEDSLERAREEARRGETKPWPEVRIDSRKWDEDIVRDFAPNADGAKWLKEVDDEIDRGDFSPIG